MLVHSGPMTLPVHLEGDTARAFEYAARLGSHDPPDAVVTVREITARRHLAWQRTLWVVRSLFLVGLVTLVAVCGTALIQPDITEAQLGAFIAAVLGGSLVLAVLLWRSGRARREAALGPLDAPRRVFRVEPDALVIEAPGAPARRLRYADIKACAASGHRLPKSQNYKLIAVAVDDGAGAVELHRDWLEKDDVFHALAHRLTEAGLVTVEERPFDG